MRSTWVPSIHALLPISPHRGHLRHCGNGPTSMNSHVAQFVLVRSNFLCNIGRAGKTALSFEQAFQIV